MTAEAYQQQAKTLAEHISLLSVKAEETASKLKHMVDESSKTEEDRKVLLHYSHIEELTQDVVDVFVKRVGVYKDKRVVIEWNFGEGRCRHYVNCLIDIYVILYNTYREAANSEIVNISWQIFYKDFIPYAASSNAA